MTQRSWPFVRRSAYDTTRAELLAKIGAAESLVASLEGHLKDAQSAAAVLQRAVDELMAEKAEHRVASQERSKLTQAIRDEARGPDGRIDARLVAYFRGRAGDLRRAGKDTEEIIETLGQWQTTERSEMGLTVSRMLESAQGDR